MSILVRGGDVNISERWRSQHFLLTLNFIPEIFSTRPTWDALYELHPVWKIQAFSSARHAKCLVSRGNVYISVRVYSVYLCVESIFYGCKVSILYEWKVRILMGGWCVCLCIWIEQPTTFLQSAWEREDTLLCWIFRITSYVWAFFFLSFVLLGVCVFSWWLCIQLKLVCELLLVNFGV